MNNPFWEQQQQLFKMWNDSVGGKLLGMDAYENMYKAVLPSMTEYWSRLSENMPNLGNTWQTMLSSLPGFDTYSAMWPYKVPGMDIYAKAFDLWKGIGDPTSFIQNYQEKYEDLMQEIFKSCLPNGNMPFLGNSRELLDTCINIYKSILSPWMKIDTSILERIASGDRQAYMDFFKDFNQKYEETFDKLFNMMGMGANREANNDQMRAMSSYFKMLFAAGELTSLVLNSTRDSMRSLLDRYQSGLKEGKVVTTFREFYELWYSVTEEVLLELLNTDEFSKAFANFGDKYAQYIIAMNKVYERSLAYLPIPTKTDMDSLYRTVYDLRKDVRDLRRELDALKAAPPVK